MSPRFPTGGAFYEFYFFWFLLSSSFFDEENVVDVWICGYESFLLGNGSGKQECLII